MLSGGRLINEPIALGQRQSPMGPVEFGGTGEAQPRFPARAASMEYIGRGGGALTENFVCHKEHASHWAAMVYSRITLPGLRGVNGTLIFEDDVAGRISLINAVCQQYDGHIEGRVSYIKFLFRGGIWWNG